VLDERELVALVAQPGGAEVGIWQRGRARAGRAELVAEPLARRELISGFLRHNPYDAHHYGVETDSRGRPLDDGLDALADASETKVLSITAASTESV
jgi:hypothetical protein